MEEKMVNIVGAGLAGLGAALELAGLGVPCRLISLQPSERAQSVMAEGGINGALDTMGEGDSPLEHMADTLRAGGNLADPEAVKGLTEKAPAIIYWLAGLGVPFARKNGKILLRNFGGQKKKRTAFAYSSTGKMLMSALLDACRRQEETGMVKRFCHHAFEEILFDDTGGCGAGIRIRDIFSGRHQDLPGSLILAFGGPNGLYPGMTTGSLANSGRAAAKVFEQGIQFANLEMVQYHPTTIVIPGKRCLISEAARGEGGRLFCLKRGKPWYFMEEMYPEMGNLMPRDVVSREMQNQISNMAETEAQIYLDLRGLSADIWKDRLPDLRKEIQQYLGLDPAKRPVPVAPGIHYFMGGIDVNVQHETNIPQVYAAGECCCQYHGANRLGGNSLLGALYGGQRAARTAAARLAACPLPHCPPVGKDHAKVSPDLAEKAGHILGHAMGILREEKRLEEGIRDLDTLWKTEGRSEADRQHLQLTLAMVKSAQLRKESLGAHFRTDFTGPSPRDPQKTIAIFQEEVLVEYRKKGGDTHENTIADSSKTFSPGIPLGADHSI